MNLEDITPNVDHQYLEPYKISNVPLYVNWSRTRFSNLPLKCATTLLNQAIELGRYESEFKNDQGKLIKEGNDLCIPPRGFDKNLLDNSPIGPINYETYLILPWLIKINDSLKKHNISTIQSQPAYYVNLIEPAFKSYFQVPFVEFLGSIDALEIYQKMESDPRLSKCYFNTFYQDRYPNRKPGEFRIRFCIMRPFVDLEGNQNSDLDDEDFWTTICDICSEY